MAKKRNGNELADRNVSFRLTPDLMRALQHYAQGFQGETGRMLTPGQAARRLVTQALNKPKKTEDAKPQPA